MNTMDMSTVDKLLTTTRSVRKRLDLERPVPREVIMECIELALQAPSGTNQQNWRFMAVTDAEKRAKIGEYYRQSFEQYAKSPNSAFSQPEDTTMQRVASSSEHLAMNMGHVPVIIILCYKGRTEGESLMRQASVFGSMLPAAWSLMMALRSRRLGSAWTTIHLRYEQEVAALLGIPPEWTQGVLLPVAYYTGDDFKPAKRTPAEQVTYWDGWGE